MRSNLLVLLWLLAMSTALPTSTFAAQSRHNVTRARVTGEGTIEHLLPPEYHGDPLREAGCLAFRYFGWEMLDEIRSCGFGRAEALFYWSRELGYLGIDQMAFLAEVSGQKAKY